MVTRAAGVLDIEVIRHIACLTWPVAYANILSDRQLAYMLSGMYSYRTLLHQITEEGHLFFIAEKNGRAIGFAGCSPTIQTDSWKLHKIYVLPDIQKSGAGKALMETVIETARKNGANALLLNVNRQNPAFQYYINIGFTIIEAGDFDIGAGFFMNDYVMKKSL